MFLDEVRRGAAHEARDVTTDKRRGRKLGKPTHQADSMPAITESRGCPKQCVEAQPLPRAAAHLTKEEVKGHSLNVPCKDPCGLQVVREREASSNTSHSSHQNLTPDAKSSCFVEEFREMFLVAGFFGVHVIKRLGDGCYTLSLPRLCVALSLLCLVTACMGLMAVGSYLNDTTHDLRLFVICNVFSGSTSFFIFLVWLTESSKIMAFLAEVDDNESMVKKPKWLPLVMVAGCLLPLAQTAALLIMTPLTDYFVHTIAVRLLFLSPVFLSGLLPCLIDIYIMSAIHVVVARLRALEGRVRGEGLWTPRLTNEVADHWLRVTKLLGTCNEVSSEN